MDEGSLQKMKRRTLNQIRLKRSLEELIGAAFFDELANRYIFKNPDIYKIAKQVSERERESEAAEARIERQYLKLPQPSGSDAF